MLENTVRKVTWMARATTTIVGLAIMLALVFGVATTALAGTGIGATFNLGQANTVNAISKLVGSVAGPSLQIDNNSTNANATALDLQVEAGKAPMKVSATAGKATNLNADKVDGKDANQLVRVASFGGQSPLNGPIGTVATTINAPAPGFLVIAASSDLRNGFESDIAHCFIEVNNEPTDGSDRFMELNAQQGNVNRDEDCSTNTVEPVAAGTHTVELVGGGNASATNWGDTSLWAIYVPFDGAGAVPSSAAQ